MSQYNVSFYFVSFQMTPHPVYCSKCGRKCQDDRDLRKHLNEHHYRDDRVHACRRCHYRSSRSSNLQRHYRLVHEKEHRKDPLCLQIDMPLPSTSSPAAVSVHASPSKFDSPKRMTGKPLAMLLQSMQDSDDNDVDEKPIVSAPTRSPEQTPQLITTSTSNNDPAIIPEIPVTLPQPSTEPRILVSVVEQKILKCYSKGRLIRQMDSTETYLQHVPASWDRDLECHHELRK